MMKDLRAHHATLQSFSSHGTDQCGVSVTSTHQKDELKRDNESDHNTLSRANYIEGKKLSERRLKTLKELDKKQAKERLFADPLDALDGKSPTSVFMSPPPVEYEALAMGTTRTA